MPHPYLTDEQIAEWVSIKGNMSLAPTYFDLFADLFKFVSWYYQPRMWRTYRIPQSMIEEFTMHFFLESNEIFYIIFIAFFITILRYIFERKLCRPLVDSLKLIPSNKLKFPESAWKCSFYTCTWSYCVYLLMFRYNYFAEPFNIWEDWESGMAVPTDIKIMYFVQCGFYLHSVYGTIYMDLKRKDFYAMLLHHFLTMALILVSYATRYHKIGLLVLFVHDITDILLESAKVFHHLSLRQDRKPIKIWDTAATITFILFTFSWFLFRLYWYPLKVLYTTGVIGPHRVYMKGCGLYGFFNSLLWLLLGLNFYWLYFILQFLLRACTGMFNDLRDVREDDEFQQGFSSMNSTVKDNVNSKQD